MNKWLVLVLGFWLCGNQTNRVWAQTGDNPADWTPLRPSFGSRLNHLDGVLKGKRTVRIVGYAPSQSNIRFPVLGKNNKVAQLRLDNEPIDEPFTNMPHEFVWDTALFADGTHVLSVMLLDTETRDTETLDKVVVTLSNGRPAPNTTPELAATLPPTPERDRRSREETSPNPVVSGIAQITAFDAEQSKSDHPLMATATALCEANGTVYLGLKTGGIAACNPQTLTGWAVRPALASVADAPGVNEPVRGICADKDNVYWTTSVPGTVFRWDIKARKATAFVLSLPPSSETMLPTIGGRKLILTVPNTRRGKNGGSTAYVLDTKTGAVEQAEQSEARDGNTSSASADDLLHGAFFAPRYSQNQIVPVPVSQDSNTKNAPWRQIGPDIVAQWDDGGGASAYLPWNGAAKDGKITAALCDASGLWIATEKGGVRHITPNKPDAATGYDGYLRVRLSDVPDFPLGIGPNASRNAKVAALVEEWQGTPYLWGGETKKGCDCSGFIGQVHHALGVSVPRSSDEMRASKQGERVHDELHYGDVLVFPGHVALYIGNGKTAETVGGTPTGSVSKATIWGRREVAVRRYLK